MVIRPSPRTRGNLQVLVGMESLGALSLFGGWAPELRFRPSQIFGRLAIIFAFNVCPILFFRRAKLFVDETSFGHTNLFGRTKSWSPTEFVCMRKNIFDAVFIGHHKVLFKVGRRIWDEAALARFEETVIKARGESGAPSPP